MQNRRFVPGFLNQKLGVRRFCPAKALIGTVHGISRNARGETMAIPRQGLRARRSSSPVTMTSDSESKARASVRHSRRWRRRRLRSPTIRSAPDRVVNYLVDTNVLSEPRKRHGADSHVVGWFRKRKAEELFLSVLTVGELRHGVERVRRRDSASAEARALFGAELHTYPPVHNELVCRAAR